MCTQAIVLTLYSNPLHMQPRKHTCDGEVISQQLYERLNKEEVHLCAVRTFRTRKKKSTTITHLSALFGAKKHRVRMKKSDNPQRVNVKDGPPRKYSNADTVGVL
jgi:hypothetical protein